MTSQTSPAVVQRVAERVAQLAIRPRGSRWTSVAACVLDAVWSIASDYDRVVVPLVHRVLGSEAEGPLVAAEPSANDSFSLGRFLERFPNEWALLEVAQNRQRTSTRNGLTKAEAALRYARILVDHGVDDLPSAQTALATPEQLSPLDRALSRVPGEGRYGIRRGYFWMLCGADDRIKPDRRLMRWLAPHGVEDPATAQQVLAEVAVLLAERAGAQARQVTLWEIDHAIWLASEQRKTTS